MKKILAGAILALFFAGCSGSGSVPTAPTSPAQTQAGHVKFLGHLNISRADAQRIAGKVRSAHAYASPMRGGHVKQLHAMTVNAGNDLVNNGGPTMSGAHVYNILVNAQDESTWGGKISQFEGDLFGSSMINILDQYIGASATGQFSVTGDYTVTYDTSSQLADQDLYNIVYQIAQQTGQTGYGNIYNVFFDSTVTQCSQNAGGCYAQNGGYCAFHGNTDFTDIGHVIFSNEPYQNIQGCTESDGANSPNGVLADSTASTLSHEMFESFTDPDVPQTLAWYNQAKGEIGDICAPAAGVSTGVVQLGADNWDIQPEYSNSVHDCSWTP